MTPAMMPTTRLSAARPIALEQPNVVMPSVTQITPTTTIAMLLAPAGNTFGVMKPPPPLAPNA